MLAKGNVEERIENKKKRVEISKFNGEEIMRKRLHLLNILEKEVDKGNLKAIELYGKILSELREDVLLVGEDESWIKNIEELLDNHDD